MIKNIIFDLGHVLLDLDFEKVENSFKTLLQDEFDQVYWRLHEEGHFLNYELGKFEEAVFIERIQLASAKNISAQAIIDAWNSMLVQIPKQRIDMLRRLKNEFNVFLLSNTNATHIKWLDGHLQRDHQINIRYFDQELFQKAYYSHKLHLRKPNQEIYELVLSNAGIRASETLFIDDLAENLEGARSLGIKGYQHMVGHDIAEVIHTLI
jgi:putative hydrolase of the HAD superfamily